MGLQAIHARVMAADAKAGCLYRRKGYPPHIPKREKLSADRSPSPLKSASIFARVGVCISLVNISYGWQCHS